jgi:hypothetical protein
MPAASPFNQAASPLFVPCQIMFDVYRIAPFFPGLREIFIYVGVQGVQGMQLSPTISPPLSPSGVQKSRPDKESKAFNV